MSSDLLVSSICDLLKGNSMEKGFPTQHKKGDFAVGDLVSVVFLGKRHNGIVSGVYDRYFAFDAESGLKLVVPYVSSDSGPIIFLDTKLE